MKKKLLPFLKSLPFLSGMRYGREHLHSISPVYNPRLTILQGSNDFVFDSKGKKYIDFTSGVAVNAFGHRNTIQDSIAEQASKIIHTSNLFATPVQIKLTKKLVSLANRAFKKGDFSSAFLSNSGTEATECAIKFARLACNRGYSNYENKYEIISCKDSFHGRTMGALSVTGQETYQQDFKPLLPGVKFIEYNNIENLKKVVSHHTAAIILETTQGEGGLSRLTEEFAQIVMEFSKKYNFFIIIDEIQTGLYRTGTLFNIKKYPLTPHLITLSKALGGGLPLGAVITTKQIHNLLKVGDHGSTTGGNPVACAGALNILNRMRSPFFHLQRNISHIILQWEIFRICKLSKSFTRKGKGFLLGIELPTHIQVGTIIARAQKKGLLLLRSGENTIRIAPSLVCDPYLIKKGMEILRKILKSKLKNQKKMPLKKKQKRNGRKKLQQNQSNRLPKKSKKKLMPNID